MAKRFIDTGIFDDEWFMDLSKDAKLFWIYCITRCNHAGVLELNKRLCKFQTRIDKPWDDLFKELGNRCVTLKEPYIFIPKFLYYQYPNFPNSKVKAQQSAIEILQKFNLLDEDLTLKEGLGNPYGYGNGNGNGSGNESGSEKSWRNDFEIYKKELDEAYKKLITDKEWIEKRKEYHPDLNIIKSVEKAINDFWGLKAGWKHKKKSKSNEIDWKMTLTKALDLTSNKVWLTREEKKSKNNPKAVYSKLQKKMNNE